MAYTKQVAVESQQLPSTSPMPISQGENFVKLTPGIFKELWRGIPFQLFSSILISWSGVLRSTNSPRDISKADYQSGFFKT